jgi:hypothetical protein
MPELEPPVHASSRLCSDNRTKAPKSHFESPQPFAVPIRPECMAKLSEGTITGEEFSFMISH